VVAPLVWLAVVLRIEVIHAYHATQALLAGGVQLPPALLKLPWIGDQLHDLSARILFCFGPTDHLQQVWQ